MGVLPNYKQCVQASTRGDRSLDLCYCLVKRSFKSIVRSPIGNSDRNSVHLLPEHNLSQERYNPISNCASEMNDYRPVALTSIVMKCFKKLIMKFILPTVAPLLTEVSDRRHSGTGSRGSPTHWWIRTLCQGSSRGLFVGFQHDSDTHAYWQSDKYRHLSQSFYG